jgi:uncharacterized repeat protein (TIGR03803 family)
MHSAIIRRHALPCVCSLALLAALVGCHWGSGNDSSGSAPVAPAATYSVGGTVSGLASGAAMALADNGADSLSVSANGAFTFATALPADARYAVTTGTAPAGQTCTVADGVGTIGAANVTSVVVTCSDQAFTLGGPIQGLSASGLVLANGSTTLIVSSGAQNFTFPAAVDFGSSYNVTVSAEPADIFCKISEGSGIMPANGVTNIEVDCFPSAFTLGGTIQGLTGSGLVLANGSATVTVPASASSFTFPTLIGVGTHYDVTVSAQPSGLSCTVSAASGTMPGEAIKSVAVSCIPLSFSIGGTLSGLGANSGLVLANGADSLVVPAGATQFTMPASLAGGAQYDVTVAGNPPATACVVSNGSGTVAAANVTNITITCKTWVESVLYSFAGPSGDGAHPWWGTLLLANDGNFYGTTSVGGSNNDGTVFKITPAGVETLLWSFGSGNDGNGAYGSLIQGSDGSFYGMTDTGGIYTYGTVFRITPAGDESVLWSFGNTNDGMYPLGSLVQGSDGNFYGLTHYTNATTTYGTVFRITPAGVESVLWTFGSGTDGQYPFGSLIVGSDGNLYGMTEAGGIHGSGTIFKITLAGAETVLWSFGGNGDGSSPMGNLTQGTDGNFYGMTSQGGAQNVGVVFKMTPGGAETVLHSFNYAVEDGWQPQGELIQGSDGNFYGMTEFGGLADAGTFFQITPGGAETVIWSFLSTANDGQGPIGGLALGPGGVLYGMATYGGAHGFGAIMTLR